MHHSVVLEFVRSTGEYVKSHLSYLERPMIEKVRRHFPVSEPQPKPEEAAAAAQDQRPAGLTPPPPREFTENNPYKGVLAVFTKRPPLSPWPSSWRRQAANYRSATPRDDPGDYSPAGAYEASESMKDHEWRIRGVSDAERDVWLAHGLASQQARIAAGCQEAGIRPADLTKDVNGFTVFHRITHGEPPDQVARLMARQADTG